MADAKALADLDVSTAITSFQGGDLFFVERSGSAKRITWTDWQTVDVTFSGSINFTGTLQIGGTSVTATAAELNLLDGLAAVSGADTTLITGTAGTDGYCALWNADGDLVDGVDLDATYSPILTLATASTATGVTEIEFTSIPAGVNEIVVMLGGVSLSGTEDLLVQIGDSGGFETSGYVATSTVATTAEDSTAGFPILSNGAAAVIRGRIVLSRMTGNQWTASGTYARGTGLQSGITAGDKTLSAELDRIRIKTSGTDTIDANAGVNISYR